MDKSDAVIYDSTTGPNRGGPIATSKVPNKQRDNFFDSIDLAEAVLGSTVFWGGYVKNDHPTENADNVTLFIDPNTVHEDDEVQVGLEPNVIVPGSYQYDPHGTFNGTSDFVDVPDAAHLDLEKFTISCWFRTSADYSPSGRNSIGLIVNKGGFGSAATGENMSYGLYIATDNKIYGGFEETDGTGHSAVSFTTKNDGLWHHAAISYYNKEELRLYIDGVAQTPLSTTTTPEINAKPLTIGKNSRAADRYFEGDIDEVYVWSNGLNPDEIQDLYQDGIIPNPHDLEYSNTFGSTIHILQTIANINTSPLNVEFKVAPSYNQGAFIGQLRHGEARGFWLRRAINPTHTEQKLNSFSLNIGFDPPAGSIGGGSGSGSGGGGTDPPPNPGPTPSDLDMAFDGDWGTSSGTKSTISNIDSFASIKHIVNLGDTSYENTADKWESMTANLRKSGRKMYHTVGNHDTSSSLISAYKRIFGISKNYNSSTIGNILLINGNMYESFDSGSAQYKFIKSELEKAKNNSSILWKIVTHHEPLVGSSSQHRNNGSWKKAYQPLYEANGVDLVLNGHNHHYERSYPLRGSSIVNKSQEPNYTNPGAPIYITCGLGGHDVQYKFKGSRESWSAKGDDTFFGFLMLSLSDSGRKLTGKCYKNNKTAFETFSITKT